MGELGVSPGDLRAVARRLDGVSGDMKGVLSSLLEKLAGEGAVWGDDRLGDQFAKGGQGYLAQLDWVAKSVGAKTELLDRYSQLLKEAADSFEQQDQG
jgi:uncharacterized protein YukE